MNSLIYVAIHAIIMAHITEILFLEISWPAFHNKIACNKIYAATPMFSSDFIEVGKGGLISESFFNLAQNSKNGCKIMTMSTISQKKTCSGS